MCSLTADSFLGSLASRDKALGLLFLSHLFTEYRDPVAHLVSEIKQNMTTFTGAVLDLLGMFAFLT